MDEASTPFRHGVASGDPTGDAVVIWTRVTAAGRARPCRWRGGSSPPTAGRAPASTGSVEASPDRDWTVAVDVGGLAPGRRYRYGFDGARGVDRGRADPDAAAGRRQRGCASPRSRARSSTPGSSTRTPGSPSATTSTPSSTWATTSTRRRTRRRRARRPAPTSAGRSTRSHECRTLDDYRRRYAQYRARPGRPGGSTPRTRSSPRSTTTSSPTAPGATARTTTTRRATGRGAGGAPTPSAPAPSGSRSARPIPADPSRVFRTVRLGDARRPVPHRHPQPPRPPGPGPGHARSRAHAPSARSSATGCSGSWAVDGAVAAPRQPVGHGADLERRPARRRPPGAA